MTVTRLALNGHGSVVVKALNEAITVTMNEFGGRQGCGPMHWYLREVNGFDRGDVIGFPGGPNDHDPATGMQLSEAWAGLLGLVERTTRSPDTGPGPARPARPASRFGAGHEQPAPAVGPFRPAQALHWPPAGPGPADHDGSRARRRDGTVCADSAVCPD